MWYTNCCQKWNVLMSHLTLHSCFFVFFWPVWSGGVESDGPPKKLFVAGVTDPGHISSCTVRWGLKKRGGDDVCCANGQLRKWSHVSFPLFSVRSVNLEFFFSVQCFPVDGLSLKRCTRMSKPSEHRALAFSPLAVYIPTPQHLITTSVQLAM